MALSTDFLTASTLHGFFVPTAIRNTRLLSSSLSDEAAVLVLAVVLGFFSVSLSFDIVRDG
jgi:hypothetical protein